MVLKLKQWLLRKLISDQIRQGYHHEENIRELYRTIWTACQDEFCEDSRDSLEVYLRERFDEGFSELPVG